MNRIINKEKKDGVISGSIWKKFNSDVLNFKKDVTKFFDKIDKKNLTVMGLGASTKGNVLLQYLNIDEKRLKLLEKLTLINLDLTHLEQRLKSLMKKKFSLQIQIIYLYFHGILKNFFKLKNS